MRNSLSARLTYRIMAVVLVMMIAITGVVYFTVRKYMLDEAKERYLGILLKNQEELRRRLSNVCVAVENNVHDIERDIDNPDKMFDHVERLVRQNSSIACCAMLFEHNYYSSKGRVFIPCARKDRADSVRVTRIDSTYNSYFYGEWFQEHLKNKQGSWTEAYIENKMFAEDQEPRLLTTYSVPVHNREGRPIALLTADLSLDWLREEILEDTWGNNRIFEKGQQRRPYIFVIDSNGIYIIHPDKQRIMKHFDKNVGNMMATHRGTCVMEVDGVKSWLYYRTVKLVNWVMVIVVPENVILANAKVLNIIILLVMTIGLLAIYLFCRHQIRKTTTPLKHFADTVDQMAMGNFSTLLPEIKNGDEVRQLHDAFANMQTSLTIFVDELRKTTTQKASLESELKIANAIQMAMLPKSPHSPLSGEVDLYATLTPAREVGGDLYDYFLRDNRLFFCIGDVSGKGIPAALMMAVVRAMFRGEARHAESATAIVDTLNRNINEESTADYFVTMFVGILDLTTGHLDYCNAGHEPPLIAGHPMDVKLNLPVGALSDWDYESQQTQLQPDDMLFLYTDGLSEAMNTAREQFGRSHVQQLVMEHGADTAQQLVALMEAEVHRHVAEAPQSDDITIMAIKWLSQGYGISNLSMSASIDDMGRLKPFIVEIAQQAGMADREVKRLRLAVEEAVVNIINHGQATTITLQAAVEGNQLVLTIDDDGLPFDPTKDSATDLSVPADERPPGGLGIVFLHGMTEGLDYQRIDGHNVLIIKKKL